jgi:hypothetical protein
MMRSHQAKAGMAKERRLEIKGQLKLRDMMKGSPRIEVED